MISARQKSAGKACQVLKVMGEEEGLEEVPEFEGLSPVSTSL